MAGTGKSTMPRTLARCLDVEERDLQQASCFLGTEAKSATLAGASQLLLLN